MMGVTLICPNLSCGRTIIVPEQARGKVVRCAHCNQPFMVPALERTTGTTPAGTSDGLPAKT
jgi:hypothetical protein